MLCKECGTRLMDSDQFCPKCGARVLKAERCPDCGEILRDGAKFCPECGRPVGSQRGSHPVFDETMDIPIEVIERNILSETAAEIRTDRRAGTSARRVSAEEREAVRSTSSGNGSRTGSTANGKNTSGSTPARKNQQASVPAPPSRKKPVYREEVWEDDDWDEDDDDWEDEAEGIDAITVMTVIIGCILLIVVAVLGYHMCRQYLPKNYDKASERQEEQMENGQEEQDSEAGDADKSGTDQTDDRETYTLKIVKNVNVRDYPSTSGTNILKVAQEGETYVSYGTAGDGSWYEIVLEDGSTGYVFQDYVSIE